jgi:UDP-glucuronate 4-epimerase
MAVLVTGAAGFIGMHVAEALLRRGEEVVGLDNLNDYYDVSLKDDRLSLLRNHPGFSFVRADLGEEGALEAGLPGALSTGWCISPLRRACAIPFRTRVLMPPPI